MHTSISATHAEIKTRNSDWRREQTRHNVYLDLSISIESQQLHTELQELQLNLMGVLLVFDVMMAQDLELLLIIILHISNT